MSDNAAFLAAIAARPDDDLPRLVFADWLDEHREPERAEFIRLQCELATLKKRTKAKQRREQKLLHVERCRLFNRLGGRDAGMGRVTDLTFRRGFLSRVFCPASVQDRHAGWLGVENPGVHIVAPSAADLVSTTLQELGRLRFSGIMAEYQQMDAIRRLLRRDR